MAPVRERNKRERGGGDNCTAQATEVSQSVAALQQQQCTPKGPMPPPPRAVERTQRPNRWRGASEGSGLCKVVWWVGGAVETCLLNPGDVVVNACKRQRPARVVEERAEVKPVVVWTVRLSVV